MKKGGQAQLLIKRVIDIILSSIGLVLLALPFALIAIVIKLDSRGSVFFRQERVADLLNQVGKPRKGSKVLILGVAYERDVNDIRESPALDIIGLLLQKGAEVSYNDPYVSSFAYLEQQWESQSLNEGLLQE